MNDYNNKKRQALKYCKPGNAEDYFIIVSGISHGMGFSEIKGYKLFQGNISSLYDAMSQALRRQKIDWVRAVPVEPVNSKAIPYPDYYDDKGQPTEKGLATFQECGAPLAVVNGELQAL